MAPSPRQAVLEHLARTTRAARVPEAALTGAPAAGRVPPAGGPAWQPRLDSVVFLRERRILDRHVCVVRFEADHVRAGRRPMTMVLLTRRVAGRGWVSRAGCRGGTGLESGSAEPHVELTGSWGSSGFCGAGCVRAAGADVHRVRLSLASGIELEDDAHTGWVVFFTDRPVESPAATVELLDASGEVVASHGWPPGPDLADELRRRLPRA